MCYFGLLGIILVINFLDFCIFLAQCSLQYYYQPKDTPLGKKKRMNFIDYCIPFDMENYKQVSLYFRYPLKTKWMRASVYVCIFICKKEGYI